MKQVAPRPDLQLVPGYPGVPGYLCCPLAAFNALKALRERRRGRYRACTGMLREAVARVGGKFYSPRGGLI
eukprot:2086853-Rhodomonas_salina.1